MADAPKSTARRDRLVELQNTAQAKWDAVKAFEVDAPSGAWDGGKYMVTFPYPYMNGKLHLGHAFSLSKAEFSVGFQRLLGKKALFPFAFHCTGMPIQAAAFKLKKEYDLYGSPLPNFPCSPPEVLRMDAQAGEVIIGWKQPTCTGGKPFKGCKVLVRVGSAIDAPYQERGDAQIEQGEGSQWSATIGGLTAGEQVGFKVVSVVDGLPGVESKAVEKSPDGKHPLKLRDYDRDKDKDGASGAKGKGGGKPTGKPAAKIVAKTGGLNTQWDILASMGLTPEERVAFTDPVHWLKYFPPLGKQDMIAFGTGVDWRRSFITTDFNPYYDSFVRWQFYKLKEGDFIAFGKRPSLFSEADGQPCMDHDRYSGEGVGPQEYTALKIQLLSPLPKALATLEGRKVYALAATLRPETMCGQTNVWALPDGEYGCFEVPDGAVYICAARAARNMGFQEIFGPDFHTPKAILTVKGSDLIGAACKAPSTKYEKIYMLPLMTISMTKGTAIVTSVPSDSPDDYAAFMDLKNPKKREHYGVRAEWVDPFELIPIIRAEIDGEEREMCAEYMCQKLKVQSQKDVDKLHQAHDIVYTAGFYKGVMTAGEFVGKSVQEAKPQCKKAMCDRGEAFTYLEPEGMVTPRSTPDVECVVALVDQWYLKYGEKEWAAQIAMHLKTLNCFNPSVKKAFEDALAWLSDWACSRSFGLGTRVPWDEQFLIESLSDSTIYMAYYLVAHLLQGGALEGRTVGPSGVKPEQCTGAFWDCVMLGKAWDASVPVPQQTVEQMRREVAFWYPMDVRISGRDLIPNHLTMSLYNHAAVWKDDPGMWPRAFLAVGLVQVDGEKMSKSKGNFVTLEGAIEKWGSDATRFACADSGDGLTNANFRLETPVKAILYLTTELDWITATLMTAKGSTANATALRKAGVGAVWFDAWFGNEMLRIAREAREAYTVMRFKDALKLAFFEMKDARDTYRTGVGGSVGVSEPLVRQWAEWIALMMAPITPHWSEAVWSLLGKAGLIVHARWPNLAGSSLPPAPVDPVLTAAGDYLFGGRGVAHQLALARDKQSGGGKKGKGNAPPVEKPNQASVFVARNFPRWKELVLESLAPGYRQAISGLDAEREAWSEKQEGEVSKAMGAVLNALSKDEAILAFNKGKQVAQFAAMVKDEAMGKRKWKDGAWDGEWEIAPKGDAAFALKMSFDEASVLQQNVSYLLATLGVDAIHVLPAGDGDNEGGAAVPGKPQPVFFHAADLTPPPPPAGSVPFTAAAAATGTVRPASAPASTAAAASSGAPKVSMMEYLEQHKVATTLNAAVNELASEQPADPYAWLASKMQALAKGGGAK